MSKFVKRRRTDDRKNLLEQLKKYQLDADQMTQLHSTSSMQTKGLKKFTQELPNKAQHCTLTSTKSLAIQLSKRRRRRKLGNADGQTNVIASFSSSSEDTDDISTDDDTDCYYNSDRESLIESSPSIPEVVPEQQESPVKVETVATDSPKLLQSTPKPEFNEKAVFVPVVRLPEIEEARLKLPIIGEEQNLIETIRYNDIVIVSGETGSGKTTQLPQFLYEAGYALNNKMIGITEPRRVAAISMSERVAKELNLTSKEVSYQIRFSSSVSSGDTKIKFMTDGVLLRECQEDLLLSKYSVIIIDEAHERSVFSDILIGLLSRIVPLRTKKSTPLKLIVMSATLRVSDFTQNSFLFKTAPPIINIEARQFPVTVHFAKTTPDNHLQAAYKKIVSIDSKMPKGGILVFVTSQADVKVLCRKLKSAKIKGLHVLGLYAMLPLEKQRLVFRDPPEGFRLCVIATNVAETSITIPNIKYVVDTGLEKTKVYDLVSGISKFSTTWTSKSSAEQRKGRAGRIGPGQCYRLYSSAVFTNDFPDYAEPRILQKPVEDVLLQMKSMNIINVVNFPFPTRPSLDALIAAENKLMLLGALKDDKAITTDYDELNKTKFLAEPTKLGKAMSKFAISARCSKMIVLSPSNLLSLVIDLVSALSIQEMFLDDNKCTALKKKWAGHGARKLLGDFMSMLRGVRIAESFGCSPKHCIENGLRTKAMLEIHKLKEQLLREVNKNLNRTLPATKEKSQKPTEAQCTILRQLLLSSYCDHVARKIPDCIVTEKDPNDATKIIKKKLRLAYECIDHHEPAYISPESVLKGEHPEFIIYKELYQGNKKTYMRDVAVIDPAWLLQLPGWDHRWGRKFVMA